MIVLVMILNFNNGNNINIKSIFEEFRRKRVMRQNKTSGFGQFFASNELALCYVKIFVQQNVCVQILVTTWTYFVYLEKVTKCKFSQFHKMDISF